ncbi:MAG: hypothetical protein WED15_07460 [Akkermansiaceae bacterium]
MTQESPTIEVEVVAIDGATPPAQVAPPAVPRQAWQEMRSRVLPLGGRWWPLWVVLAAVALVFLLTVGLVVGLLYLILRVIRGILRAVIR